MAWMLVAKHCVRFSHLVVWHPSDPPERLAPGASEKEGASLSSQPSLASKLAAVFTNVCSVLGSPVPGTLAHLETLSGHFPSWKYGLFWGTHVYCYVYCYASLKPRVI